MSTLQSVKKAFKYIAERSFCWDVPRGRDVVFLDEVGSDRLIPFIGRGVSFFVIRHEKCIYVKHVFKSILRSNLLSNKGIYLNYFICIIEKVSPRLLITNVDNDPNHWKLDLNISKDIKFITVQNGTHLLGKSSDVPREYRERFLEAPPYYSNLLCFSQFDYDHYQKFGAIVENCHMIGSMSISEYISNYKRMDKEFDICIVANSRNNRSGCVKIIEYLAKYLDTHDVSVRIALKKDLVDEALSDFNQLLCFDNVSIVERSKYSSHYLSDISKVTIGHGSTLLRQTFARGNKIYPLDFVDSTMHPPFDLLGYSLSPAYDDFESHLDYLLDIDPGLYIEKNKSIMSYIDTFDTVSPPHVKFKKIVSDVFSHSDQ